MTPTRLRECLATLGWSQRTLAKLTQRDDSLVRRWADGDRPVPEAVAAWLERMAAGMQALLTSDPPPGPSRGPRAVVDAENARL